MNKYFHRQQTPHLHLENGPSAACFSNILNDYRNAASDCFCLSRFLLIFAEESSDTVKVASYILIGVGSLSMALGFFGCIGAIYEVRCLLGLVRTLYIHSTKTDLSDSALEISSLIFSSFYNLVVVCNLQTLGKDRM